MGMEGRPKPKKRKVFSKEALRAALAAAVPLVTPISDAAAQDLQMQASPYLKDISTQRKSAPQEKKAGTLRELKERAIEEAVAGHVGKLENLENPILAQEVILSRVLSEQRFTLEQLKGTKYDTTPLKEKYVYMVRIRFDENGNNPKIALIPPGEIFDGKRTQIGGGVYGNAVFITPRICITAGHVLGPARSVDTQNWLKRKVDFVLMEVPEEYAVPWNHVVPVDFNLTNEDVSHNLGAIIGADDDADKTVTLSDASGIKQYIGIPVPRTDALLETEAAANLATLPEEKKTSFRRYMKNSFMFPIPHGEVEGPDYDPIQQMLDQEEGKEMQYVQPTAGMSGSALFTFHEGRWVLGGWYWGAGGRPTADASLLEIGNVFGIDTLKEVISSGDSRYDQTRLVGAFDSKRFSPDPNAFEAP